MKVICKECGKKFDYDVYMGLCPKCSTYYRDGMGSSEQVYYTQGTEVQKRYDAHREREERIDAVEQALRRVTQPFVTNSQAGTKQQIRPNQPTRQSQPMRQNQQKAQAPQRNISQAGSASRCYHGVSKEHRKEAGKKSSPVKAVILVLVFTLLLGMVLPVLFIYLEKKSEPIVQGEISSQSMAQEKTFSYSAADANYEISIKEVRAEKGKWFGLPEGYELIRVKYQIDTDKQDGWDGKIYSDVHMRPYLITKSGEYLTPCYTYEISEAKGWDYDKESEVGLSNQFCYEDGVIYFAVQKKQAKGLLINSYNYDEEEYCETTVRESFLIEELEVKR